MPVRKLLETQNDAPVDSTSAPHTMTNAELMHHFWKLNVMYTLMFCVHVLCNRYHIKFVIIGMIYKRFT